MKKNLQFILFEFFLLKKTLNIRSGLFFLLLPSYKKRSKKKGQNINCCWIGVLHPPPPHLYTSAKLLIFTFVDHIPPLLALSSFIKINKII